MIEQQAFASIDCSASERDKLGCWGSPPSPVTSHRSRGGSSTVQSLPNWTLVWLRCQDKVAQGGDPCARVYVYVYGVTPGLESWTATQSRI